MPAHKAMPKKGKMPTYAMPGGHMMADKEMATTHMKPVAQKPKARAKKGK